MLYTEKDRASPVWCIPAQGVEPECNQREAIRKILHEKFSENSFGLEQQNVNVMKAKKGKKKKMGKCSSLMQCADDVLLSCTLETCMVL